MAVLTFARMMLQQCWQHGTAVAFACVTRYVDFGSGSRFEQRALGVGDKRRYPLPFTGLPYCLAGPVLFVVRK